MRNLSESLTQRDGFTDDEKVASVSLVYLTGCVQEDQTFIYSQVVNQNDTLEGHHFHCFRETDIHSRCFSGDFRVLSFFWFKLKGRPSSWECFSLMCLLCVRRNTIKHT